jgi:hypothetical protein
MVGNTEVIPSFADRRLERGITLRKGGRYVDAALPGILSDATSKLSGSLLRRSHVVALLYTRDA